MNTLHVVGTGGIGGFIIQTLDKSRNLFPNHSPLLWDKDKIEEKNLDRQFFTKRDINRYKSKSFGERYNFDYKTEWFTERSEVHNNDIIFVCADNNGARLSALNIADRLDSVGVIIGANETIESQAYIYFKEWKDTPFDPRTYYPILLEHDEHDPTKEQCTGHVLEYTPQLAIANMLSASLMFSLYYTWFIKLPSLEQSEHDRKMTVINTPKKLDSNSYSKVMYNSFSKEYLQ